MSNEDRQRLERNTISMLAQTIDSVATGLHQLTDKDLRSVGMLALVIQRHAAGHSREFQTAVEAVEAAL